MQPGGITAATHTPRPESAVYYANDNDERMRNYLSIRNREEVATTEPCIMCSIRAQSETDYFCGNACRRQALGSFTVDEIGRFRD